MRICWLLATRVPDVPSPLVSEVCARLRSRGHDVEGVVCERRAWDLDAVAPRHDLYVLKSHTELALTLAATLADAGARVLNPVAACDAVQDKARAFAKLRGAGVPVPRTTVVSTWEQVTGLATGSPLLVKPLRGHRGAGVEVVDDVADLAGRPDPITPLLVQELVPGPGEDLKVYVVGDRVWAVRKRFAPDSFTRPGRPVPVTDEIADLALRAGHACGLSLFGLDVIESPSGPVVVDLNYLPGYKGCDEVAGPMAELVHRAALDASAARRTGSRGPRSLAAARA